MSVDWQAQLAPGERLLWQGRPDAWPVLRIGHILRLLRGGVLLAAVLYILVRLRMTVPPLWDVRTLVLVVFFMSVPLEIIADALSRAMAHYALTDRRALIAWQRPVFGLRLRSIPIGPATVVDHEAGRRGSVLFDAPGSRWAGLFGEPPRPGFLRIADSGAVFSLTREIQRGKA